MAKTSGGVRSSSNSSGSKNYSASVGVVNASGQTRYLTKSFRTQKQAEGWAEGVARRFDSNYNRTAYATDILYEKKMANGYMDIVGSRDLMAEAGRRESKAFRDESFYKRDKQSYEDYRKALRDAAARRRKRK